MKKLTFVEMYMKALRLHAVTNYPSNKRIINLPILVGWMLAITHINIKNVLWLKCKIHAYIAKTETPCEGLEVRKIY